MSPVITTILQGLDKIKDSVEAQPKSITKRFQVLLFPEYNAGEYYRLVFGRILSWMLLFLIATYLFMLGKEYIEVNGYRR